MLLLHLYIFFDEMSVQLISLFINSLVFLLLNFKSYLYILESNPLSDMYLVNILSQSVACLSIL